MQIARQPMRAQALRHRLALGRAPRRHDVGRPGARLGDGLGDLGAAVTDVGHDRPASGVENPPAIVGDQPRPLTVHDPRYRPRQKWPIVQAPRGVGAIHVNIWHPK